MKKVTPVESQNFKMAGRRPIKHAGDRRLLTLLAPMAPFSKTGVSDDLFHGPQTQWWRGRYFVPHTICLMDQRLGREACSDDRFEACALGWISHVDEGVRLEGLVFIIWVDRLAADRDHAPSLVMGSDEFAEPLARKQG